MKITLSRAPLCALTLARMAAGIATPLGAGTPPAITHICTDSREADADTLLCAIRGERVDGHSFMTKAYAAGCRAFLCERIPDDLRAAVSADGGSAVAILVPDTVAGMGALAATDRAEALDALTAVAITGSVGKTTTKETVAAVLAASRRVFKKDGNFNSTIGLPLSVLEIDPAATDAAVLEMGMSARGEILSMTTAVRPDIAVIANIGSSHLEHLGTRENIARAKLEICAGLRPGGTLLVNGDEPLLHHLGQDFDGEKPFIPGDIRVLRVSLAGDPDADLVASAIAPHEGGMRFDLRTPDGLLRNLWIPAPGEHLVWAGAFAAAVGLLCGLDESAIRAGLATYRPAALRQQSRTASGVTLLEDCYNAAPESMRAALGVLDITARRDTPVAPARRLAVLGDMKELGDDTAALHRAVGAEVARRGIDRLWTVGPLGAHIAAGALECGMPASAVRVWAMDDDDPTTVYPALAAELCDALVPGDILLFKASRAMALETLSRAVADTLAERESP